MYVIGRSGVYTKKRRELCCSTRPTLTIEASVLQATKTHMNGPAAHEVEISNHLPEHSQLYLKSIISCMFSRCTKQLLHSDFTIQQT